VGAAEKVLRSEVEVRARPSALFVAEAFVSVVGIEAVLFYFVTSC